MTACGSARGAIVSGKGCNEAKVVVRLTINFAFAWRWVESLLGICVVELSHRVSKSSWWR